MSENNSATIFGLASAAVLSNIPPEWLGPIEKLIYGAFLAFITGCAYKAGGWVWEYIGARLKR